MGGSQILLGSNHMFLRRERERLSYGFLIIWQFGILLHFSVVCQNYLGFSDFKEAWFPRQSHNSGAVAATYLGASGQDSLDGSLWWFE